MVVLVAILLVVGAYYMSRGEKEPSRQQYDVQATVDYPVARAVHKAVRRAAKDPVDPCERCRRDECLGCPHDPGDDDDSDDEDEE